MAVELGKKQEVAASKTDILTLHSLIEKKISMSEVRRESFLLQHEIKGEPFERSKRAQEIVDNKKDRAEKIEEIVNSVRTLQSQCKIQDMNKKIVDALNLSFSNIENIDKFETWILTAAMMGWPDDFAIRKEYYEGGDDYDVAYVVLLCNGISITVDENALKVGCRTEETTKFTYEGIPFTLGKGEPLVFIEKTPNTTAIAFAAFSGPTGINIDVNIANKLNDKMLSAVIGHELRHTAHPAVGELGADVIGLELGGVDYLKMRLKSTIRYFADPTQGKRDKDYIALFEGYKMVMIDQIGKEGFDALVSNHKKTNKSNLNLTDEQYKKIIENFIIRNGKEEK